MQHFSSKDRERNSKVYAVKKKRFTTIRTLFLCG